MRVWVAMAIAGSACARANDTSLPTETDAREALEERAETALISLEAALAFEDWRVLDGAQAEKGTTHFGLREHGNGALGFHRRWVSGYRGRELSLAFNARGSEVPLVALYGPDTHAIARRVAYVVGEGVPARAVLRVTLPAEGRYLLMVADLSRSPEMTMSEPGRAIAYLAAREEDGTCDCPCEETRCVGDELWSIGDDGTPSMKLKACGVGECVDVTEAGAPHGECVERTACCADGGGLCEVDQGGSELRRLRGRDDCLVCSNRNSAQGRPQARCETPAEHCDRLGGGGCEDCAGSPRCGMCDGMCVPNTEDRLNGIGCTTGFKSDRSDCSEDEPPPPPPRDRNEPTLPDAGFVQPAAKAVAPSCEAHRTEDTCVRDTYCGWCAEGSGACLLGNASGPSSGACALGNWRYSL